MPTYRHRLLEPSKRKSYRFQSEITFRSGVEKLLIYPPAIQSSSYLQYVLKGLNWFP